MKKNNTDWLLFLSLEKDFIESINYVNFSPSNNKTTSINYLKLLIITCSSIEKLLKKYCEEVDLDFSKIKEPNIKDLNQSIMKNNSQFSKVKCVIPRYKIEITPWCSWASNKTPKWWTAYNNVKHNNSELEDATQENVYNSLAALFTLNLYYYKNDLYEGSLYPLANLFNYEKMPGNLSVNPGAELPGYPR